MIRPGHLVALCAMALLMLGVVMVNSAGMTVDPAHPASIKSIFTSRPVVYMGLALLAMAMCSRLPVRRITNRLARLPDRSESGLTHAVVGMWAFWGLVACLAGVLLLVYLPGLSRSMNGSTRWIEIPLPGAARVSIQPSEIVKWCMVGLMAWYGASLGRSIARFWTGLVPALAGAGLLAGMIVLEDLGTGALVGAAAAVGLLAAGARIWHVAAVTPIALTAGIAAIATNEYRVKRLTAFLDPYADPQGTGFHMIQSMVAIANGDGVGRGLGHGLQKFGYLWGDETDFVFSVVCEELGIAGAALIVFLFIGMLWAGFMIVRREESKILKLFGVGVLSTIGLQAVINIGVVTGLGPTKGIALPLVSAGGTGWILTAAALGVLLAMDRSACASPCHADNEAGTAELVPVERSPAVAPAC